MKRLRVSALLFVVTTILSPSVVIAEENAVDLWKRMGESFTSGGPFDWTLAEAPFSAADRNLIYGTVDKPVAEGLASQENNKAEERNEVMTTTHIKLVGLAVAGPKQMLVFGPDIVCGGTGNCPIRVFARVQGHLRLVLDSFGSTFFIQRDTTRGFHNAATYMNSSFDSGGFGVYRWTGASYRQFRCVSVQHMVVSQGECGNVK